MLAPSATLREITDAIAKDREEGSAGATSDEMSRLYSRARTMRDRGLIRAANRTSQGKENFFEAADIAAAVVAITISLNGGSIGQIEAINGSLRTFDNTQGIPAFEMNLARILAGVPVFIRLDFLSHPWPSTRAKMGTIEELDIGGNYEWIDAYGHRCVITQSNLLPVTTLVHPIFRILTGED
ncbi:MAG: hypothetical protein Q8Q26_14775 [Pseudorhodobacter sp.]|nr:hypothetical protein [Pseudorhodobacter sp.]